jgi:hypothetical protein
MIHNSWSIIRWTACRRCQSRQPKFPDRLLGIPSLLVNEHRNSFSEVKRLGREVIAHFHLKSRVRLSRPILLNPLYAFPVVERSDFTSTAASHQTISWDSPVQFSRKVCGTYNKIFHLSLGLPRYLVCGLFNLNLRILHSSTMLYLYNPPQPWRAGIAQSNPGRSEIFRTRPVRPWGTPSLLYNG